MVQTPSSSSAIGKDMSTSQYVSGIDPLEPHLQGLEQVFASAFGAVESAACDAVEAGLKDEVSGLDCAVKDLIQSKDAAQKVIALYKQLEATGNLAMGSGESSGGVPQVYEQLLAALTATSRSTSELAIDFTNNVYYQRFREAIWDVEHPDKAMPPLGDHGADLHDNELVVGANKQSLICPLTQRQLEDPVRNTACNHVYSKAAIQSLIRRSHSIQCPITGCSKQVTVSSLVQDSALALKLERLQNRIF